MIRYDFVIVHNNLTEKPFSPLGEIEEVWDFFLGHNLLLSPIRHAIFT